MLWHTAKTTVAVLKELSVEWITVKGLWPAWIKHPWLLLFLWRDFPEELHELEQSKKGTTEIKYWKCNLQDDWNLCTHLWYPQRTDECIQAVEDTCSIFCAHSFISCVQWGIRYGIFDYLKFVLSILFIELKYIELRIWRCSHISGLNDSNWMLD